MIENNKLLDFFNDWNEKKENQCHVDLVESLPKPEAEIPLKLWGDLPTTATARFVSADVEDALKGMWTECKSLGLTVNDHAMHDHSITGLTGSNVTLKAEDLMITNVAAAAPGQHITFHDSGLAYTNTIEDKFNTMEDTIASLRKEVEALNQQVNQCELTPVHIGFDPASGSSISTGTAWYDTTVDRMLSIQSARTATEALHCSTDHFSRSRLAEEMRNEKELIDQMVFKQVYLDQIEAPLNFDTDALKNLFKDSNDEKDFEHAMELAK